MACGLPLRDLAGRVHSDVVASRIPALRGWLVVLVLGAFAGLLGAALLGAGGAGRHTPAPVRPSAAEPVGVTTSTPAHLAHVDVLHRWDRARADAWAHGDARRLRSLYVDGSSAGRADVALLARYRRRGLVVTGMRRQVVAVRVLEAEPTRLRLRVTDRLVGAVARSADASAQQAGRALPSSRARTRTLVLRRAAGEWRMASVRSGSR